MSRPGRQVKLRNVAIIAHVDHGKTTLVDGLLHQAGTFGDHEERVDRVMDSGDLERERGITILSKNTAVQVGDVKINIVDTPGHADFGGEVERVMKMVDAALLLVDASEGPLPQTRFVLRKALDAGLEVMVCINKVDRPDARIEEVVDEVYDLFIDLDASDEQIEFPIVYACAKDGWCTDEPNELGTDFAPLFRMLLDKVPEGAKDSTGPVQMLVTQLDYDTYVGRLAIGRIQSGTISRRQDLLLCGEDADKKIKVKELFTYQGLRRVETDEAFAGDLVAIAGVSDLNIGDTLTEIENPQPLPRIRIDEPTIGMTFRACNSPFSGREGKKVTARQIKERLDKELLHNVALKLEQVEGEDAYKVYGRGELQLAILIEQMRREGFELSIGKPEVRMIPQEDGSKHEPFERAQLDFPEEFMGVVSEKMSLRKGRMNEMKIAGGGRVRVEYRIPARGLIGFRGEFLNDTRGQGILNTLFDGWDAFAGYIPQRVNGSLIADRTGVTTAYALYHLQPRGKLFMGIQVEVYEGMIVGENARENDINVDATKSKQLTNFRSSGADEKLVLAPPIPMNLDKALEYIADDELIEVTPSSVRLRKKILAKNMRSVVRGEKKDDKKGKKKKK
ncbi:MAG: translational GTPase TypA [Proteobacteria bacterium]|nr:translational GTPase TypA [Pseudomonadota bacterium]MCP4916731.1 translational GTPase TypA [Pseudomonadota bacterium]